jgi:2-acylglycerol O-acyltransferase 2
MATRSSSLPWSSDDGPGVRLSRTQFAYFIAFYLLFSFHPLPNLEERLNRSRFSMWTYKYFSYRLMWSGDAMEKIQASAPWMGASGPHSVMPFGSLLNIPAVNTFVFRKFKGGTASVLRYIPMLRYLYLWGAEECSGKNLAAKVQEGYCVGVVSDGIAGIFKSDRNNEAFFIKDRKALARWCLKHGVPIVPAYSIGNSLAFYSWFDSFGILEWISRKTQVALFLYFGRMALPIPFRVCVTQLLGAPILVEKVENPTQEQVDAVHQQVLDAYVSLFETHKHALGWSERQLKLV